MKKIYFVMAFISLFNFSLYSQEGISDPDGACPMGYTEYFRDADGDGYGNPYDSVCLSGDQAGYTLNNGDCDDSNAAIHPGTIWYRDADGDGFGDPNTTKKQCLQPSGYVLNNQDCDDSNAAMNPNTVWYRDADGDGYGDPSVTKSACNQPLGYVSNSSDCDDTNSSIKPGATEILNGKDDNCDGTIDNGTKPAMPSSITVTKYCDYTKLTRGTPPAGVTWYWQSSSGGVSTSNSSSSINRTTGTIYYLRARDDSTLFWSDARSVTYSVDKSSVWYSDADSDGFGDPSISQSSCTQPAGYVANNNDLCPDSAGPENGCPDSEFNNLSNENYVFTRTYQTPLLFPGDVTSSADVQDNITYFDGLGRPMQQTAIRGGGSAHPSIINTNSWQLGSGSAPFYNRNGLVEENHRVMGTNPFGRQEILWKCGNDVDNNADGGWNTDYFSVDKNASYRYSVWVKRIGSQDGRTYHGTQNVNNLDGTSNSNPYFWSGDMPNVGEWYLLVGVIHPYSYGGGNSGISGVYDRNGTKVSSGNDFKWMSTSTRTRLRSYLYYATNTATRQYFWQPVFQKLDGTESSISELVSKTGKADVVTHISYDQYGRQAKDYLPVPMEDGEFGSYRTADMPTATASYYLDNFADDFPGMTTTTANPFSEKLFELSPLNRVEKQAAPGSDWRLGSGHEIELSYFSNGLEEVRLYKVTLDASYKPSLSQNTSWYYEADQLYKTVTKDENWTSGLNNTTEEFKDKQGRVVLKRTYADSDLNQDGDVTDAGEQEVPHDTHYVYDDYGNLTYVIPPKVVTFDGVSSTELAELCYQYRYDHRNRLVEKKIPGKGNPNDPASGWEYIIYNKLDQPIMTQDPNLKAKGQWLFTKYDAFGRVAYTGIIDRIAERSTLQAEADTFKDQYEKRPGTVTFENRTIYYTNRAYPDLGISKIHTENYYDTYLDSSAQAGISVPTANSVGETISTATKGLPTVSKVRVLGTSNWITTVNAYEKKGRAVWSKSVNSFHSTTDLVESDLDFTGKVKINKTTHSKSGQTTITTTDTFSYDHMGRLVEQHQKVNSNATELIARNTYDEVGQLVQKQVGGIDKGIGLQNVELTYNVRGWLKQINNPGTLGDDLFGFKINYNTVGHSGTPLFNGNIAETEWKTQNDNVLRWYKYGYDNLNRITSAIDGTTDTRYSLSNVSYDKNGNISNLTRKGAINDTSTSFGNMDVLSYAYINGGNRLQRVNDTGSGTYGFVNGAGLTSEYTYDGNGNMKTDSNKGVTGIDYNHLNLPKSVTLGGGTISYIYDATGVKQRKLAGTTTTDYAGNYMYKNNVLQFFNHTEGYVEHDAGTFKYHYQYKDHLGNIRLSYFNNGTASSPSVAISEENNYYPFGLSHKGYNDTPTTYGNSAAKMFKFGGKELQDETIGGKNLDWYDFHARNYDAALGRWMNVDPLADAAGQVHNSPYNYALNNPIYFIDPDGNCPPGVDCIGVALALFNNAKNTVNDFIENNDLIFDVKGGVDLKLGAGLEVNSKNLDMAADLELLNVELVSFEGDMTDLNSSEIDYVGKDGELEISQKADLSLTTKDTKFTAIDAKSSFSAYAPNYSATNKSSSVDFLSKTSLTLESSSGESGGLSRESTYGNVTVSNGTTRNPKASAKVNATNDSSTVSFGARGGAILNFNVSVNLGFQKKK